MTGHDDDGRGQSAIIGIVLLVGLVAVGGIGILLIGGTIQDETRQRAENQRIEQSFLELGRDLNTVSRSDADERVTDLELPNRGDSAGREGRSGRIWVNRTSLTTRTTEELVNRSIGSIRYDTADGTTFAYQSGAVFRQSGNQTTIISNPSFDYSLNGSGQNPTLTLPIVTTVGPDTIPNGEVRARKLKTESPINDDVIVENDLVSVTVKSEWYVGWADYFRAIAQTSGSTESAVTVDHSRQTATLELIVPVTRQSVAGGVVGGASGSTFVFSNNVDIDSYNSSKCGYAAGCGSTRDAAKVIAAGNLTFENQGHVSGDVEVGGTLEFDGNSGSDDCPSKPDHVVCGNASYGSLETNGQDLDGDDLVGGWANDNASVIEYDPVDGLIQAQVLEAQDSNENADEDDINESTDTLSCSGGCEFDSGYYYLDDDTTIGSDVDFDTTGGDVTLVINGTLTVDGVDVEVLGDNRVNVYVDSAVSGDCDMSKSGGCDLNWEQNSMTVPDDNATQFWIYTKQDAKARLQGGGGMGAGNEFVGVVFGPGGDSAGTDIGVYQQGQVYGGLVGEVKEISNNADVHFDRSLLDARTVVATTEVPRLTFLVVTSYLVEVDND